MRSFAQEDGVGATNRDRLRFCVQSLTPVESDRATQEAIAALIPILRNHPDWQRTNLDRKPPSVEIGCPGTPRLAHPTPSLTNLDLFDDLLVAEASPFRVFIYVVSAEWLTAVGFSTPLSPQLVPREVQYEEQNHSVGLVTTYELYAMPDDVANAHRLIPPLKQALYLRPQFRTITGSEPILLRSAPDSQAPGVELASDTVLSQWSRGDRLIAEERWIGVEDDRGRQGWVRLREVTPVPDP